jgi:hypothetical protein
MMNAMRSGFLFIIFLISAGIGFYACNSSSDGKQMLSSGLVTNPNTANGKVDQSMLPVITFTEVEHDFGLIMEGETVSYNFKFRNTGKSDLVITEVSTSCGCTVPSYPKNAIRPGEEGIVKVAFNSRGKRGYQTKSVVVLANTQPNATQLRIKAQIAKQ